jgi:hypothetical protein
MVTAAVVGVVVAGTTSAAVAASSSKPRKAPVVSGVEIGSTVLGTDLMVSLRVYKSGKYDASVDVAAFRHVKGEWRQGWHQRVPGTWLWGSLTGKNGVCSLAVTTKPGQAAVIDVSLLITPAVGCSNAAHFTIA